ncbi:MAG TPA: phosphatase PAP2 family protein [Polyangiaceae bacterium]
MAGIDLRAFWALYGGDHGVLRPMMIAFTLLGSGWAVWALVPLLWHPPSRGFARALAAAIAVQAVLVWSLKLAVGRVRPWIALSLPSPIGAPHDPSFPSGHASGSFCVAAFLWLALPWPKTRAPWHTAAGRAGILGASAFVGLSRVYLGAHFPGDVVAGAVLGASIGTLAGLWHLG